MTKQRILVIEDDAAIRRGVVDALSFAGYEPLQAADGAAGLEAALNARPDLVLLDLLLPRMDGLDVLQRIREEASALPVIILTARGTEDDRVKGLKLGADDYVVKPFSAAELLARVEAVLRRSPERVKPAKSVKLAGRAIDFERRTLTFEDGETSELSERECALMQYLVENRKRVVSREELLRRVWGIEPKGLDTRTVDMHVARLREKLRDKKADPEVVVTVRGKGYRVG